MSLDKTDTSIPAFKAPFRILDERGITFIELIIVCAILGVLALMAIPNYTKAKDLFRGVRALEEIRGLEKAILATSIEKGALPSDLTTIGMGTPTDPWGTLYEYYIIPIIPPEDESPTRTYLTSPLNSDFDLYSKGANHASDPEISTENSNDDILRIGNGGSVGLAKDIQNIL
jgi:general secretion pathway protein G